MEVDIDGYAFSRNDYTHIYIYENICCILWDPLGVDGIWGI